MNYLGIDYGEKRIGLSYADELGVAVPLDAARQRRKKDRMRHIGEVIAARDISYLVVGYPINMDGSEGFKAKEVDRFIDELQGRFGMEVHRVDETLTTYQAEIDLKSIGKRLSRKSGEIDSRAATLILKDFLDAHRSLSACE